ncbi:unannotated protein [freshwater metagenome]|uniref:Unannotated protein n=2 Tax=freshwater metagenome TaxID=449393 RepID=A0A6J6YXM2_9ZZZZ
MNFPNQPRRTKIHLTQLAPASPDSSSTLIDCGTCVMRETDACADCVVTFLFQEPSEETENDESCQVGAESIAVVFDISEIRAMRALAEAGLVPTLRHRASG